MEFGKTTSDDHVYNVYLYIILNKYEHFRGTNKYWVGKTFSVDFETNFNDLSLVWNIL